MKYHVINFLPRFGLMVLMLGLCVCGINAQSLTVKGVVKDQTGETLIGVSIVEKGTTNGIISDIDGQFTLRVSSDKARIVFSYIGYKPQELTATGQPMNVIMQEDLAELQEVVVIGYGTAKRKDLTGAISTVKAEKMEAEAPRTVQDLLRASAAGLSVTMSTNAAGTADLQVRGKNTLSAKSSPLIVLDGVIFDDLSLQDINPMDIETIDVLKDASSVAVYGAKAASGVVAIVTKKGGKGGKPTINFNSTVGLVQTSRLPKTVDGAGFIKFRQDYYEGMMTESEMAAYPGKYTNPSALSGMGVDPLAWYNYDQGTNDKVSVLPDDKTMTTKWLSRLSFKNPEVENYFAGRETDWDDIVYQTGLQQDYNVSISSKTDHTSYYWSMGYADREGVKVGDRYRNFRNRLNLETKVTSFLTVGINAQFATRIGGYMAADDVQREHNSPYTANEIDNLDSPYRMYPSGDNNTKNPFFDNLYRDRRDINHDLATNLFATVKLPLNIEYQMNFSPRYHWYEYMNHESSKHPEWAGEGGKSERRNDKTFNWQIDNIIRWKQQFGRDHRVELTLLQNAEKGQYWKTQSYNKQYTPSDVLGYHNMAAGTVPSINTEDTYKTGDALMARLFYSFKDRYMLTASIRRDGYSAFGVMNPRATFPAVALGWVFTSENFMEATSEWFSYGKLRFSWGQNGNRDIGQYEALASMNSSLHPYISLAGTVFTTSQIYVNRMANSALQWERTGSYNLGLDFTLFHDRISGSVETYMAETNDLLMTRALPSILGFANVKANLGALTNRGFEMTLNGKVFEEKDFSWNTSGTFSFNRRKVKHLYGNTTEVKDKDGNVIGYREADDIQNGWYIGHDPDQIFDYERNGVWQLGEEEEAAKYGNKPGDFKYVDQNEDNVLNNDDKVFQGYKTPRYRVSWRNEFTFKKDFSLSFMMYSNIGQYDTFNRAANNGGMYDRYTIVDIPRWTVDNPTNDYGRIGSKNSGSNYVNKTFVRMENITLSYNVPKNLLQKISVQNMRISVAVRNPFVITGWTFGDPEGGDVTLRTYNLGVNFTL